MVNVGDKLVLLREDVPRSVIEEAETEAFKIWESNFTDKNSFTGRPRTHTDILKDTLLGKLGEYFLKSKYDYVDDNAKWHDLISPDGERTEVKTWRKSESMKYKIESELNRLKRKKNKNSSGKQWFFSTKLIIITYEAPNIFEIHSIHDI